MEVGCGTGTLSLLAKIKTGISGRVCGIDEAPEMVKVAQKKAARRNENVKFLVGDISRFPQK